MIFKKMPEFWWQGSTFTSLTLAPLAGIYDFFAHRTLRHTHPPQIEAAVLCVGNFTLGGTGKTPLTRTFAQIAQCLGLKVGIVSRGTGRQSDHGHLVDPHHDRAQDVGDEPLLLARFAPVIVGVDRYKSAQKLCQMGCNLIIMDDGLQSRRLFPDYVLMLVDASRGIGNGQTFPAGPLRVRLNAQLALTHSILLMGEGQFAPAIHQLATYHGLPIQQAHFKPQASQTVVGKKFLAFAGIGNPQRFFQTLTNMGGEIVHSHIFADHHFFSLQDIKKLAKISDKQNLWLATTAKDHIRIATSPYADILKKLVILDIEPDFIDPAYPKNILQQTIQLFHKRKAQT